MTNHIRFEIGKLANVSALSVRFEDTECASKKEISKVSERFLHMATLLPENKILGFQLSSGTEKKVNAYVFSSNGIEVNTEDYNWIFKDYGSVKRIDRIEVKKYNDVNRKLYILSSTGGDSRDTGAFRKINGKMYIDDDYYDDYDYDSRNYDTYFMEMFDMLMDEGAVIQVIAGSSSEKVPGHGMILISIPGEMSLRMKSLITLAFPHTEAEEISKSAGMLKEENLIPDEHFEDGMTRLLSAMAFRTILKKPNGQKKYKDEETDFFDIKDGDVKPPFEMLPSEDWEEPKPEVIEKNTNEMTIDELELSVRSYNCLKRANINTVDELRRMSDEDLMRVRNLGQKGREEIKRILEELGVKRVPILPAGTNYRDMLNELIGLQNVKEQVRKIAAFARMNKELTEKGNNKLSVALNMEFVGNPGTAKTTVARIMAGIFFEIGLLRANDLVEVGRADLVARYEGQTAGKVKDVFRRAKGRVLFIDEAYSLLESQEGEFGDEAINTIVQEMENNREDTIVIFAGYPDKMEGFFGRNPGLRSRVPFCIHFRDYSAEEMLQIAELEATRRSFRIAPEAKEKLLEVCEEAAEKEDSGNGRFCRNLVENAILEYAARVYGNDEVPENADFELVADDFRKLSCLENVKTTNPIGFRL